MLQALLREGVSIRDLGTILEAIGDRAAFTRDPSMLAEYARQALARTITAGYLDDEQTLRAISLEPALEQEIAESVSADPGGRVPGDGSRPRAGAGRARWPARSSRRPAWACGPVLICSSRIRRHLRRLVEQALPQLPVVSYNEILPGVRVETTGVVSA